VADEDDHDELTDEEALELTVEHIEERRDQLARSLAERLGLDLRRDGDRSS